MYEKIFATLKEDYPDFFQEYINFFMERFIYSNTEIEGIKTSDERKMFVESSIDAFNFLMDVPKDEMLSPSEIRSVGDIINKSSGIGGFRKININPGDKATFIPPHPNQIYMALYSLFDNYYHLWDELDPFLRESMFHINFMRIHPFEDGNKRTNKIILSTNLLKSSCAPVIITEEDTDMYYSFINNQDYEGFAEFLKQRSRMEMDTLVSLFKMKYHVSMNDTPKAFEMSEEKGR